MDTQERARLLREILEERVFDDKAWEALYDRLAKQYGCPYLPGSLCELEMIERYTKGNKPISVRVKPIKVGGKPISVNILIDGWPARKLEKEEAVWVGANTSQSLEGEQFLIEKGDYKPPKHNREVRSVRSWIICQFALIRGCRKPWIKECRNDRALPDFVHPLELTQRYFFAGMQWDDRLIQNCYFNVEKRMVFFHFRRRDRDEEPHSGLGDLDML